MKPVPAKTVLRAVVVVVVVDSADLAVSSVAVAAEAAMTAAAAAVVAMVAAEAVANTAAVNTAVVFLKTGHAVRDRVPGFLFSEKIFPPCNRAF